MKDPSLKLHMCGLGLALAPCFWVGVHRRIMCFLHYCAFRELKRKFVFPHVALGFVQ